MFVSITLLRLKSPLHIPKLIRYASPIISLARSSSCLSASSSGIWLNHYTMTIWENEKDMKALVYSREHKTAMAHTQSMASLLKFYKAKLDKKPSWKEAKILLHKHGRGYEIK